MAPLPLRRLRTAVAVLFAMLGFVFGSWAARLPDVSSEVMASHSALGVAVLFLSLGALAATQLVGKLIARFGAGRVSVVAAALLGMVAVAPGQAASVTHLSLGLLFFGVTAGAANLTANSLGVQLEARWGRPLLSYLHAMLSFGGVAGAIAGGALSTVVGVAPHLLAVALLGFVVLSRIGSTLIHADEVAPRRAPDHRPGESRNRRRGAPTAVLVVLGGIAGVTAYGQGALTDWGPLYLREDLNAAPVVAAVGYAGFSLALASGRLVGGALLVRLGAERLIVGGALLAMAGVLLAAWSGSVPLALVGFGLVGLGLANAFPLAIARAGAVGGTAGVALASAVASGGAIGGPPLLGFLAEATGLSVALSTVAASAVVAALLIRTLRGDPIRALRCSTVRGALVWLSPRRRRAAAAPA